MIWETSLIQIYLDEKSKYNKATRNGIIIFSICLGLIIFSMLIPSKALIVPATAVCISILITLYRNSKTKKDDKIMVNDTLKRIDNPHKYS